MSICPTVRQRYRSQPGPALFPGQPFQAWLADFGRARKRLDLPNGFLAVLLDSSS